MVLKRKQLIPEIQLFCNKETKILNQTSHENQIYGFTKNATHIISWRTIIKNNRLAEFSFPTFVKC